jgi:hypothetical protein
MIYLKTQIYRFRMAELKGESYKRSLRHHIYLMYNYMNTLDKSCHRYLIAKQRIKDVMNKLPHMKFDFVLELDPEPNHKELKFDGIYKAF